MRVHPAYPPFMPTIGSGLQEFQQHWLKQLAHAREELRAFDSRNRELATLRKSERAPLLEELAIED